MSPSIASVLTAPLEVASFAIAFIALRSTCVGFIKLTTGATAREVADEMAAATAASFPAAMSVICAAAVYLLST